MGPHMIKVVVKGTLMLGKHNPRVGTSVRVCVSRDPGGQVCYDSKNRAVWIEAAALMAAGVGGIGEIWHTVVHFRPINSPFSGASF